MTHKFTFQYPESKTSVTVEVDPDANISEMLEAFVDYLKACGFAVDGEIYYDKNGES